MLRKSHFDQVPLKPQRVYEEMNECLRPRHLLRHDDRPLADRRRAVPARLQSAQLDQLRPGRAAGLDAAGRARRARGRPDKKIVALSGDYDFQFMIEELAVGAQHKLPYLHVVVNNSYLGLIRQSQRGFQMDFEVSLAFENINATPDGDCRPGYGVDHVAVAEGLGCKAIRVKSPNEFKATRSRAPSALMEEHQVPVVLEFILERVTNISMGTEVNSVNEFEEILCLDPNLSLPQQPGHGRDRDRGTPRTPKSATRQPSCQESTMPKFSRQSHLPVHRTALPRPVRRRAARRLSGRRISCRPMARRRASSPRGCATTG